MFVLQVDLFQLQVNTLRRYKRHYKLQTRPGLNKAQLAEVILKVKPLFPLAYQFSISAILTTSSSNWIKDIDFYRVWGF